MSTNTLLVVFLLGLVVLIVVIGVLVSTSNQLVRGHNQVRNAWAQIDVQLKRRHDLVPNLVNSVRNFSQQCHRLSVRLQTGMPISI